LNTALTVHLHVDIQNVLKFLWWYFIQPSCDDDCLKLPTIELSCCKLPTFDLTEGLHPNVSYLSKSFYIFTQLWMKLISFAQI